MHPVPIDCCQKLNASMPRILSCKVKLSLKLNVPFLSFANRYYEQCFTLILFLWFECQWQHSESPPSGTSVRGTEGREEDANKASISRVGRPEGDSLLHPSSYCTRGNQGTSAQCSLLTSPGIFHNSGNCHQESQFLTYMTCLLALSIELETHNYSIWGKRFKILFFFRMNKRQWKNRLWTLTVESKTDVCIHYRAVYCVYRDPSTPVAGILHYYSWLLLTIHPSLPPPPELSTGIHEISLCPENALLLTRT